MEDKRIVQRSEIATIENYIPNRGLTVINESGLYSLILSSKLPKSKEFKRWIFSEIKQTLESKTVNKNELPETANVNSISTVTEDNVNNKNNSTDTQDNNGIIVFKNQQFGKIRILDENGKILFCGSDVAKSLGYSKPHNAISTHCKGVTLKQGNDNLGRSQQMAFITEEDLYRLITHSKLPAAVKFENWVFDEVLPSIRKYGTYTHEKATTSNGSEDSSIEAELGRALISGDMSQISTAIGKVMSIKNAQIEQQQEEIQLLENKNANLKINNTALADEILSWETRSSVNKAIRVISGMIGMDIPVVWGRLYNELYYKHGINLRRRKRTGKKSILDTVKEKEWKPLIQSLTALCEAWDIDMSVVMEKAKLCA